jgi:hypothetical protein
VRFPVDLARVGRARFERRIPVPFASSVANVAIEVEISRARVSGRLDADL